MRDHFHRFRDHFCSCRDAVLVGSPHLALRGGETLAVAFLLGAGEQRFVFGHGELRALANAVGAEFVVEQEFHRALARFFLR